MYVKRKSERSGALGIADPGAFDIEQACDYLQHGRDKLWEAIGAGRLRYYRNGRKILIPYRDLVAYQERLVEETMQDEQSLRKLHHE